MGGRKRRALTNGSRGGDGRGGWGLGAGLPLCDGARGGELAVLGCSGPGQRERQSLGSGRFPVSLLPYHKK
ncbi:hypothetical protein chiPu_0008425 [Chiloscyllium punctatum]|uniref:Uncharacterized protein n=1 Tax=Chiloscyllium punctatum TaxID=137246 RepID=A0A401SHV9_CHIPU|nr:hypothetical protein [Chiloscyllium punctatum]